MKNKEKGMTFELKESTLNNQFLSLEIHDKTRVLTSLPGTYLKMAQICAILRCY